MKNFYAKLLVFKICYGVGWIGAFRRYKNLAGDIREKYGELTYENYSKFIRKKPHIRDEKIIKEEGKEAKKIVLMFVDGEKRLCDGCDEPKVCASMHTLGGEVFIICRECLQEAADCIGKVERDDVEKRLVWEQDYSTEMSWENFDLKYDKCERCETYQEGQCVCYAR